MAEITGCANHPGCQCARCKRPLTIDGHPVSREREASDIPRFQSARKVKPSCWREPSELRSDWQLEQTIRTLADAINRQRKVG